MLSSDNIYSTPKRPSVKRTHFYYASDDDPTFKDFKAVVEYIFTRNATEVPGQRFLYKLWYESNFRSHWHEKITKKTANLITFILSERLVSDERAMMMMVAWVKKHYPTVTPEVAQQFLDDLFYPEWQRLEEVRDKKRRKTNQSRRSQYHMKKKLGRPKQTADDSLGVRIMKELKLRPSSAPILAVVLKANKEAIASQLLRLEKSGDIVKLCRGLYAFPATVAITKPIVQPEPESI